MSASVPADTVATTLLAIDPGLTGALAFYTPGFPSHVCVFDMPVVNNEIDAHELRQIIGQYRPHLAAIERVGPMPRDGVRQAWRFSAAYTTARVVCAMMHIPVLMVAPATWKKSYNVKGGPEGKEQCRMLAIQKLPAYADQFARKKDAGRAEATLLAIYAHSIGHFPESTFI